MRHQTLLFPVLFLILIWAAPAFSGEPESPIFDIGFETVPEGTRMAGASITLSGDGIVEGRLQISGEVESAVGVRFPDGTVQTSANLTDLGSLTANDGLYNNRIVLMTPPNDYTEVCIVDGQLLFDLHLGGESTVEGTTQNCNPGDVGWLIERTERNGGAVSSWSEARLGCLLDGMRLLEPFEWQVACDREAMFGISVGELSGDTEAEWASNHADESALSHRAGAAAITFGKSDEGTGCTFGGIGFLARVPGNVVPHQYRCAR